MAVNFDTQSLLAAADFRFIILFDTVTMTMDMVVEKLQAFT